ncbi:MAG: ABC transporter permease [Chloroflexi bacterium CFX4]|nr:ABC transporter permease [Chloroflexi bacterium CFX4]MDL1924625.1 ABC transporter permease [Chloroflexi bacterium CFX3]
MTTNEAPLQSENALLESREQQTLGAYIQTYLQRVRAGALGPLPIIIGIVAVAIFFQSRNAAYLSPNNIVNLIMQMSGIALIAFGVVFVLLLGEIDLSVAYVSGVAGVIATILMRPPHNLEWYLTVPIALLAALGIGTLQGFLITTFQLPSFIVTLAGLLAWNGAILLLVGAGGTVGIPASPFREIANVYLPPELGLGFVVVLVVAYAATQFIQLQSRRAQGLNAKPITIIGIQIAILVVLAVGVVLIVNQDRGLPLIGAIVIVTLIVLTFITRNTRFGRYVFAVGGNKEAARRAGIRVERVRLYVFMLCSFMAGVGGIILASRLKSVSANQGGGQLLLNCISAAVIGGTSLFGGRGAVYSAVLGALLIAMVENGMVFLRLETGWQFIITGIVLVLAVIVDSLSQRSQKRSGLA